MLLLIAFIDEIKLFWLLSILWDVLYREYCKNPDFLIALSLILCLKVEGSSWKWMSRDNWRCMTLIEKATIFSIKLHIDCSQHWWKARILPWKIFYRPLNFRHFSSSKSESESSSIVVKTASYFAPISFMGPSLIFNNEFKQSIASGCKSHIAKVNFHWCFFGFLE